MQGELRFWRNGIYVLCFIRFSKITIRQGDIISTSLSCLTSVLPGVTSIFGILIHVNKLVRFQL